MVKNIMKKCIIIYYKCNVPCSPLEIEKLEFKNDTAKQIIILLLLILPTDANILKTKAAGTVIVSLLSSNILLLRSIIYKEKKFIGLHSYYPQEV